ncbi:MAG: hypothetical protein ACYDBP_12385 [Leptospirales bacterium]
MKSDKSGTLTEQARYRMGWRSFKEWTVLLPQCRTCAKSERVWNAADKNLHCTSGEFATSPGAVCDEYRRTIR